MLNAVSYLNEPTYSQQDFCDVVDLMANSPTHKGYTVTDLKRLVVPPLQLNQFELFKVQNKPAGFFSWAWLTNTTAFGYVTRQRRLQASDWSGGYQFWVIDVIAMDYSPRKIIRYLREKFEPIIDRAYWHRAKNPNKLGIKIVHV